jgi:hypothetical protein
MVRKSRELPARPVAANGRLSHLLIQTFHFAFGPAPRPMPEIHAMDTERFGWEESGMAASESSSAKAAITCEDFGKRGAWFIFMGRRQFVVTRVWCKYLNEALP